MNAALTADQIAAAYVDDAAPRYGVNASGYGDKLPTRYRVKLTDGRTRRVYAMVYGNSGTLYVVKGGESAILANSAEWLLELVRDKGMSAGQARAHIDDAVASWPATLREGDAGFSA